MLKVILELLELALLAWRLFTPSGRDAHGWFFNNIVGGALKQAKPLLTELGPSLQSLVAAFTSAFTTTGPSITETVAKPLGVFAAASMGTIIGNLEGITESTADNAVAQAGQAISDAFALGMSSAAVTAAFEALLPERLNTLNGIGPMLATMAGFEDVSAAIREPLYRAAFGKSAEYKFNAQFTPNLPDAHTAAQWLARGIITVAQYNVLFVASGVKPAYSAALSMAAYRPLPPFLVSRAAEAGFISATDLNAVLTFAGFRPTDITILTTAYHALALLPYQNAYLSALERSVELGTDTPADLAQELTAMGVPDGAANWVQLTVAERKLQQLAELYRKSITESYLTGQITDAQYVPSLEAIGIDAADAQAHYAVDSIKKSGKILLSAARAAASLERRQQSAAMRTAVKLYRTGTYNAAELEAALLAAGIDPVVATYAVEYNVAALGGVLVFIYGLELTRPEALLLREQVTALGVQVHALLVSYADALAALAALGIPKANALALVADWTATKTPASDIGVLEPR